MSSIGSKAKQIRSALRTYWNENPVLNWLKHLPFLFSFVGLIVVLYDYGYDQDLNLQAILSQVILVLFSSEIVFEAIRYLFVKQLFPFKVWFFDALLMFVIGFTVLSVIGVLWVPFFATHIWMIFVFVWIFLRELSSERIELKRSFLNPAQVFLLSFLVIILLGAIALMFPNSTNRGISFVDALFTSASAVCVTGLSVVDTGTYFTTFGQVVIMVLIQLGGLGIMTFTSYFSYFFTGESSYENQFLIQEMTNSDKVSDVFRTLKKVLLLTFSIEAVGAILIYESLNTSLMPESADRLFFSVFHAVSGFCNAGFSTLANNFYEIGYRFNYPLHLTVAFLIILGGIGFPILFNLMQYIKLRFTQLITNNSFRHQPWIINFNTRIVFATTFFLLLFGTVAFYVLEYNNTLAVHGPVGKVITAFFASVTPRTAGFNTVDNAQMHLMTVFLFYFLMWVGASPASTGGGIKTSTFAITVLNAVGLARGKDRIELYGRQISDSSVRRAYAQVFMSLIAIFSGFALVSYFDPQLPPHSVMFECISAFGTVGLTLGITAKLSVGSKLVITALMYVGRISLLTVFVAFLKQVRFHKYMYPSEDITIN